MRIIIKDGRGTHLWRHANVRWGQPRALLLVVGPQRGQMLEQFAILLQQLLCACLEQKEGKGISLTLSSCGYSLGQLTCASMRAFVSEMSCSRTSISCPSAWRVCCACASSWSFNWVISVRGDDGELGVLSSTSHCERWEDQKDVLVK